MRLLLDLQGCQTESRLRGIGRYTLELAKAVARNAGEHDVWLLMSDLLPVTAQPLRDQFAGLVPPGRIVVFSAPGPVAEIDPANSSRARVAELVREHAIAQLRPDVVHVGSLFEGFVDDAVVSVGALGSGPLTSVTVHDLIPLLKPDQYLANAEYRHYYLRKLESLKRADLIIAVSESSAREAMEVLGIPQSQVVNASEGADERFRPAKLSQQEVAALLRRFGLTRPFVFHIGAIEPRKNFEGLVRAYAALAYDVRRAHQLLLVAQGQEGARAELRRFCAAEGLRADEVVIVDRVSDDDLVALYSLCRLFVFPSLHEGFGLPPLEAMACGAATIGSNTTSIPEVIGRADALFDPASPGAIVELMGRALTDEAFHRSLREHALQQAARFSWDATAKRALAAFETIAQRRSGPTPWGEQRAKTEDSYRRLLRAIFLLERPDTPLDDIELRRIALAVAHNQAVGERVARSRELPEHITWRIEGPFDSSYSLALVNRETARALDRLGHRVILHSTEGPGDFDPNPAFLERNPDLAKLYARSKHMPVGEADVTSRLLYPPRVDDMASRLNLLHHYAWEESGFPAEWVARFNAHLQGITCLSRHVQKVLRDAGVRVPLAVSGSGVDHFEGVQPDRHFRVAARPFRFLHVSSCFPRKGADLLLEAYGQAFSQSDPVTLIVKTFPNPHNEIHRWLADARAARDDFPDVVIIEDDLSDAQLKALYLQCHALVAPSLAEGFGLPLAEAMLCGLPVITTSWGGQLDFCNAETAWLVDYDFAYARTHFDLFDSVWAVPRIDHLTARMREVYGLPAIERERRTAAGRALLLEQYKWVDATQRLVDAARAWARSPSAEEPRLGWVSTYNTKCGIASYSSHLIKALPWPAEVFAPLAQELIRPDDASVSRCWAAGENDDLRELRAAIERSAVTALVVQFNYGFFNFGHFGKFLNDQVDAGRIVVVTLHATVDPRHVPHKMLADLVPSLRRCQRILVHSVGDLNRLKALGLVDNVTLFPHGVLDWPAPIGLDSVGPAVGSGRTFIVASYGFFLPHKGLLELIEATAQLRAEGLPIRLRMVNAEYPVPESAAMIAKARTMVRERGLGDAVEMCTDFLSDEASLELLASADLIVFPYQQTGESSSAAVRYGLAAGRPVAVTPLAIFDDVAAAVFRLPGLAPPDLAAGIRHLLGELSADVVEVKARRDVADSWRAQHAYPRLAARLGDVVAGLGLDSARMPPAGKDQASEPDRRQHLHFLGQSSTAPGSPGAWPEAPVRLAPGCRLAIVPGDVISDAIAASGVWEPELSERLIELSREGGTLVEVGANIGYFTVLWAAQGPACRVIAVEPSWRNLGLLRWNITRNELLSRVDLLPIAAGRALEIAHFTPGPTEQTGWGGIVNDGRAGTVAVVVAPLDGLLPKDRDIAVLKIDVEGADTWVLEGCRRLLETRRIRRVFYEQNFPRMAELGISPGAAEALLHACGWTCRPLTPLGSDVVEWEAWAK
jgi:FkbM family methyltransferase